MFTGIITNLGEIRRKTESRLTIKTEKDFTKKLNQGASISVSGICLTAVSVSKDHFTIDYMPETAKKTIIQYLKKGDLVNLELPATGESFLSGHIVQGHVDCVGKILDIKEKGNSHIFTFLIPFFFIKYIVEKGSIAVNGISLTVITANDKSFTVGIIPHTWGNTMLYTAKIGNNVNIEVDILAKYIEQLVKKTT